MASEIDGTNGVIKDSFMHVAHVDHEGLKSSRLQTANEVTSGQDALETLAHDKGWNPNDFQTLLKGGMGDLYKALDQLIEKLDNLDELSVSEVKIVFEQSLEALDTARSLGLHQDHAYTSLFEELAESADNSMIMEMHENLGKIQRAMDEEGMHPVFSEAQMNAIQAAADSLRAFQEQVEGHNARVSMSPDHDEYLQRHKPSAPSGPSIAA